jgi:hypothetical protein
MPLEGELIRLREERPQDMPLLVELRNDLQPRHGVRLCRRITR